MTETLCSPITKTVTDYTFEDRLLSRIMMMTITILMMMFMMTMMIIMMTNQDGDWMHLGE